MGIFAGMSGFSNDNFCKVFGKNPDFLAIFLLFFREESAFLVPF